MAKKVTEQTKEVKAKKVDSFNDNDIVVFMPSAKNKHMKSGEYEMIYIEVLPLINKGFGTVKALTK